MAYKLYLCGEKSTSADSAPIGIVFRRVYLKKRGKKCKEKKVYRKEKEITVENTTIKEVADVSPFF